MKMPLTIWEGDDQVTHEIPAKYDVCPDCRGEGHTLIRSLRDAVFTAEDFADDPDFAEDYMGGALDETCRTCRGRTTVPVPDEERFDDRDRAVYAAWLELERDRAAHRREIEAERRMGA